MVLSGNNILACMSAVCCFVGVCGGRGGVGRGGGKDWNSSDLQSLKNH